MGGFSSIVPMATSILQTSQQLSAQQAATEDQLARNEQARAAELADITARQQQADRERADDLRRRQARQRALQGASGLMAGGSGSASAVLAGYEQAAASDAEFDRDQAARRRAQVNQQAGWRERSLLRSAQDDTVARLGAWFARRDGWGG
ncbi:hypothetical protein LPB41_19815 [Thalassospira sp. MA62]|nr:hypothetical protein [Thalassospira sp. MA62]